MHAQNSPETVDIEKSYLLIDIHRITHMSPLEECHQAFMKRQTNYVNVCDTMDITSHLLNHEVFE